MDSEPKATADEPVPLTRVPAEILAFICSYLSNKDIKALRLAGPTICHAVPPRFTRVFLSPNPRNLEVFRAIASHPTFRLGVREIVYDDARLEDPQQQVVRLNRGTNLGTNQRFNMEILTIVNRDHLGTGPPDARSPVGPEEAMRCMWFGLRRERNLCEMYGRNANDTGNVERQVARQKQRAAQTPLVESFRYYMDLFSKQVRAMQEDDDVDALMEGIEAFPALERIIVTPATHGYLYTPLYYTPMIRSFPYGFNYAIPRGWPTINDPLLDPITPWVAGPGHTDCNVSTEKARWRGLVLVIKTLAERIRKGQRVVPELVLDVHSLHTGVSPYMLTQDCEEYQNLALILQQTNFRRLDLPILICAFPSDSFGMLRNGKLKSLLAQARHLEHFRLRGNGQVHSAVSQTKPFFPLRSLLPVDAWPHLRHFGLSKFVVRVSDLIAALGALPQTLRTVELSFLEFDDATERRANHAILLEGMKKELDWAGREPAARPRVTLGMSKVKNNVDGRGLWFSKEIGEFLYDGKENPFGWHRDVLLPGVGWLADEYDEDFARPYVGYKDYRTLWYCEES
ncbi:Cyclin-like F-box [Beauveria brongniartii RCEF 3172]|uniref:Cyclin-like F-box n=1 Tax=Beauveria brongniartii RCEF 3172 TaxID=1081107 RepID=A0A167BKM2_9HYPO|nr:Cyclin-like F-box [Beauveria brongniartii RCEF 3172]